MTEYQPKVGDRVRVVLEGEVRQAVAWPHRFWIGQPGELTTVFQDHLVSIERMPDPEPEWHPGDVVLDARGSLYTRRAAGQVDKPWHFVGKNITDEVRDEELLRPLTHLVRDGKPVTS